MTFHKKSVEYLKSESIIYFNVSLAWTLLVKRLVIVVLAL